MLVKPGEKTTEKLKEPEAYRVILLNDDYTTMDFVVAILIRVFNKTIEDANALMLQIHETGRGIAGIYTWDIAVTKADQVHSIAQENEFPLRCIIDPA